jgi:NDP-sugar pyrophosphorylase family protein
MMANGRLIGHRHDGRWADVGHPAGIAAAEAMVAMTHLFEPTAGAAPRLFATSHWVSISAPR